MSNVPGNCRECEFDKTCTNQAPYGMNNCRYKGEIQRATIAAILSTNKEDKNNGR